MNTVGLAERRAGRTVLHAGEPVRNAPPALARSKIRIGNQRTIALDFDVDIILDRQRDGVLEREVEVAAAQQRIEARGVAFVYRCDDRRFVVAQHLSEPALLQCDGGIARRISREVVLRSGGQLEGAKDNDRVLEIAA